LEDGGVLGEDAVSSRRRVGTWPLGEMARKSSPEAVRLVESVTALRSRGRPASRAVMWLASEQAKGEK
jgi:hypothetical protein